MTEEQVRRIIAKHVEAVLGVPCAYGECGPWANGPVKDLTGADLLADCPPLSLKAAQRVGVHLARAARKHGWRRCLPEVAVAGSVGLVRQPVGHVVCVADGAGGWLARAERGVVRFVNDHVRWACRPL